ncbi:MAG: lysine--tRNA ligase [bacterium]|nr:lysine--tRNA ligase [bacterium]
MQWLNKIVDEVIAKYPKGEIIVSSGVSPSGKYHVGTLREVLTADAVLIELKRRGRKAHHLHFVDDHDRFRKVPSGVPVEFEKYIGRPLCDMPSPDPKYKSYADYYWSDFKDNIKKLGLEVEVVITSEKYRDGTFVEAIEIALSKIDEIKKILDEVSGRKLEDAWSPIQVIEDGYLKKRFFVSLDSSSKEIVYKDSEGKKSSISYAGGLVKLDWRLDWPARWWIFKVNAEPFGRDHATKGGSYDTGKELVVKVFGGKAPVPVPYNFINRAGETKKMSKSAGDTITITELLQVLPPEIVRFFVLRYGPEKQLFFDQTDGVVRLIDEYAELLSKKDDEQLIEIVSSTLAQNTISNVPFSHLVASYQAALKHPVKTVDIIARTEHAEVAGSQKEIIERELAYIDQWLEKWAPDDVKFDLVDKVDASKFNDVEKKFLGYLADKIEQAPKSADGEWFHKAIYELKESGDLTPEQVFSPIYESLIGKSNGPRAGWFLSILPREWLIKRLNLEA